MKLEAESKSAKSYFIVVCLLMLSILTYTSVAFPDEKCLDIQQPDRIFADCRKLFYQNIRELLDKHPQKGEIIEKDYYMIINADEEIPYLYEIIINIAYQQEEPYFSQLLKAGDEKSLGEFAVKLRDLSEDYASKFVASLFKKGKISHILKDFPWNKGKSTLELILQTLGYNANQKVPSIPKENWYSNEIANDFTTQWGIKAINLEEAHKISRGSGVTIAVIDSGIDPFNSLFKDRKIEGKNFLSRTKPPWIKEDIPMIDWGGHGTGVSSVIAIFAPECKIMPVRTHDSDTMNDPVFPLWVHEFTAAGIFWAVNNGADIINICSALRSDIPIIRKAVKYAYQQNVIIVSSAGNIPRKKFGIDWRQLVYQCFDDEVIITGGMEEKDGAYIPWEHSLPVKCVDIVVPSKDVFIGVPVYMEKLKDMYVSGTSLAAPIGSSIAALIISLKPSNKELKTQPGSYCSLIQQIIKDSCSLEAIGQDHVNDKVGYGLVNALKAVQMAKD